MSQANLLRLLSRSTVSCLALGVAAVVALTPSVLAAAATRAPAAAAVAVPPQMPFLNGVWCSGPNQCLAVGGDAQHHPISELWNGKAWKYMPTPIKGRSLLALSCSSFADCVAVGGFGAIDRWNGASWKTQATPNRGTLRSVSCLSGKFCAAVGDTSYIRGVTGALIWRGQSWQATSVPKPTGAMSSSLRSVSCSSPTSCLAVGLYHLPEVIRPQPMAASWDGTTWTLVATPPASFDAVACTAPTNCLATGNAKVALWDGSAWHEQTGLPPFISYLTGISCPSASFCMAVSIYAVLAWNGTSWSSLPAPSPDGFQAVWCGSSTDCTGVGDRGPGGSSSAHWNGTTWKSTRPNQTDGLFTVSCTGPRWCVTLGSYVSDQDVVAPLAEYWNGRSWRIGAAPAQVVEAVSCTSPSFCMAITSGASYLWNGHRWLQSLTGASYVNIISCGGHSCVAVGYYDAWAFNGSTWKEVNNSANGQLPTLTAISCSSADMCMAVGYAFNTGCNSCNQCPENCNQYSYAEKWNGRRFVLILSAVGPSLGSDVSCPQARLCIAVNGTGATLWRGTTWRAQRLTVPGGLNNISCGGPSRCLAMGSYQPKPNAGLVNVAATWNGTNWVRLHPPGLGVLGNVSCSEPASCVAVGQAFSRNLAELWNGTRWTVLRTPNL